MPSNRLEQEAQTFGLRDIKFPCGVIDSPQQMQIQGVISFAEVHVEGTICHQMLKSATKTYRK